MDAVNKSLWFVNAGAEVGFHIVCGGDLERCRPIAGPEERRVDGEIKRPPGGGTVQVGGGLKFHCTIGRMLELQLH